MPKRGENAKTYENTCFQLSVRLGDFWSSSKNTQKHVLSTTFALSVFKNTKTYVFSNMAPQERSKTRQNICVFQQSDVGRPGAAKIRKHTKTRVFSCWYVWATFGRLFVEFAKHTKTRAFNHICLKHTKTRVFAFSLRLGVPVAALG